MRRAALQRFFPLTVSGKTVKRREELQRKVERRNCEILNNTMPNIVDIYGVLRQLGITGNYKGFFQTAYAVYLAVRQPERLLLVTKWLYPEVAKRYNATWISVERNIRTVAAVAWNQHRDDLEELAQQPLPNRPSASTFLAILTVYFKHDYIA